MADRRAVIAAALRWRLGALLVAVVGVVSATTALPFLYSSEAVRLRVVEEGTDKPLAGVIGVASREVESPNIVTGVTYRPVAIREAVSEAQGWLEFPAWTEGKPWQAGYTSAAPLILLYHDDYRPRLLANEATIERTSTQPAASQWNGKSVSMVRHSGSLKSWRRELVLVSSRLPSLWPDGEEIYNFEKLPRMLAALDRQDLKFEVEKIWPLTIARGMRAREAFLTANGCRKVSEVIREGAQP